MKYAYTTDGTDPVAANAGISATTLTLVLNSSITFKVIAVKDDTASEIVTKNYVVNNNPVLPATPVTILDNAVKHDLELLVIGDMHFFVLNTELGKDYQIRTFADAPNFDLDTDIYVYNSLIDMQTDHTNEDYLTGGNNEIVYGMNENVAQQAIVHIRNATHTKYYIAIKEFSFSGTGNAAGTYKIAARNLTDLNNGTLALGSTYSHTLSSASYEHIYKIDLTNGTDYEFTVTPTDPSIYTSIQYMDGIIAGTESWVPGGDEDQGNHTTTFTADVTGTHYFIVNAWDEVNFIEKDFTSDQAYNFSISETP